MLLANIAHPNWLCIGDINHILNGDDKFSFNEGRIIGSESFDQLISDLELCELAAFGQRFTWMNNREDDDFVMERLDRAFAIVDWIHTYPSYALQNLPIIHSDHGPIMLDFELRLPFHFERMWLTHPLCKHVVQQAWNFRTNGSRAA